MLGEPYVALPPASSPRECLSASRRAAATSAGRRPLKRRDPNSNGSEESVGLDAGRAECSESSPLKGTILAQEPDQLAKLTPFGHAKRLFHRSAQVRIVGRTAERAFIETFWRDAIENTPTSGCDLPRPRVLYVCGNPGTGKTALINEMLPELLQQTQLPQSQLIKTNCMMHHDPRKVLEVIAEQLGIALGARKKSEAACHDRWTELAGRIQSSLERTARRPKGGPWTILVLDEIDQIAIKDAPLLQQIFAWPSQTTANMVIIGIANALDLSIRYCSSVPPEQVSILNFTPYSPEDISRILMARMELANEALLHQQENDAAGSNNPTRPSLISPQAVEICARKVSAVGDLRQALEIMREAISLAEGQDPQGRVEIPHVARAIERAFGSAVRTTSRHTQLIDELNLHQKLLLATLHRLVRDSATLRPTIHSLYDSYAANVRLHRIIDAVGRSEFHDLVANSESMGVISLIAPGRRKASRGGAGAGGGGDASSALLPDTKVLLALPLEDVATGLSSNPVLQQLL